MNGSGQQKLPMVSVIVPTYNRAKTIAKALKSVQGQSFSEWEAIVVDDGSTDNTCEVVRAMVEDDARIRLLKHDRNRKAQAARNTGIRVARGEWISFLDSDDEYLPDSIQARLDLALKSKADVVHSECFIIKPGESQKPYGIRSLQGRIYKQLLEKEGPVFPSLLIKKSALENIGYLDERIKAYQEWDTVIRLAKAHVFAFCSEPTFVYDYRCGDAMSRNAVLNAQGYVQIFWKHFWAIWRHTGMKGLAYHCGRIARWYSDGGRYAVARLYKAAAVMCKCFSFQMISTKLSNMVAGGTR